MDNLLEKLKESAEYIQSKTNSMKIEIGLILGSGLGDIADTINDPIIINYKDIPHFPISTVPGHVGRLVIGQLEGKNVLCMQGRFHFYEGWSMKEVVYPVQVMKLLGIEVLIVTNAAGCVNYDWKAGDLMIIKDHIKLTTHENPFIGPNLDELGPRFFDMTYTYTPSLRELTKQCAKEIGLNIREGVYMYFSGPNFETPAEIRAARVLGADAVGMSTVPEAIAASHCSMKLLGISCLANMGAGMLDQPLGHTEVLETGLKVKNDFTKLLRSIIRKI